MKLYNLIYIFLFIFLVGTVSAQPFGEFTKGLNIEIQEPNSIITNYPFNMNVHVFNSTDGEIKKAPEVSCYLHVYDYMGIHIAEQQMNFDAIGNEWYLLINASNFTRNGEYPIIAICNGSNYGGWSSTTITATPNGELLTAGRGIAFGVAGICIALIIGFLLFTFIRTNEFWAKGLTFGGMWIFFLIWNYGFWIFSTNYLWSISYLGTFFKWIFIVQTILTFPMILAMIVLYLYVMITNKYLMNMLKHGVPEDRAMMRDMRRRGV